VFYFKGIHKKDCYDGLRNFNQVRPGVFDGGYAFGDIPAGTYIVEVIPPQGYEVVQEEDKNVDFGDDYTLSKLAIEPPCVGATHTAPATLTLFPGAGISTGFPGSRPGCDRKQVELTDGFNAAANFFLFTQTPIAGHIIGFILDDTANEFDPGAPNFGEKFAPPNLPISIRDYTGREIQRVYSDEYGVYNALVPSTYTAAVPQPSGMAPNMITVCLNEPLKPVYANPFAEPTYVPDEFFNPQYSQWCYTFQYMPGVTTYLDTPVVPVAAFAGRNQFPLDCEFTDGTPMIKQVTRGTLGPWLTTAAGQVLTIASEGTVQVPNSLYNPDDPVCTNDPGAIACQRTIPRDYGFGATEGTVKIGSVTILPANVTWAPDLISVTVTGGVATGQLLVTRGDNNKSTITSVTVTVVASTEPRPIQVGPNDSIQAAIDAAVANQLIVVEGTHAELVVMWKPVRLQGWGPGSTKISAIKTPASKLQDWRNKVSGLIASPIIDILPSQEVVAGGVEPDVLFTEEGPGIIVLAKNASPTAAPYPGFGLVNGRPNSRIDGFTITGADHAGGIMVNAYARSLEISNNRIVNNAGIYGGGIRIGHPYLTTDVGGTLNYEDSQNDNINIHNNQIAQNGGTQGVGGGVSVCTGSDGYRIAGNFICGNFNGMDGAGIGHLGISQGGLISDNTIAFNETFNQGQTVSGGGIVVMGGEPLGLAGLEAVSPGTGTVSIDGNLILGNGAGAGDGGGIRLYRVNGRDITTLTPALWYSANVVNNMIVNNVAGLAGGGISLQDVARANIVHNTIANNDSTATAGEAFTAGPSISTPQPAGIVSRGHTPGLIARFALVAANLRQTFSNPNLRDNIIWRNRSFYFAQDASVMPPANKLFLDLVAGEPLVYDDLAVLAVPTDAWLNPQYCILTDLNRHHPDNGTYSTTTNWAVDPLFIRGYVNGNRENSIVQPEVTTAIQAPPAFDEGGNFIRPNFGPLSQTCGNGTSVPYRPCGDYHIQAGSWAVDHADAQWRGTLYQMLMYDFDGQWRPDAPATQPPRTSTTLADIGADERPKP
jgi:hypothetical protein